MEMEHWNPDNMTWHEEAEAPEVPKSSKPYEEPETPEVKFFK